MLISMGNNGSWFEYWSSKQCKTFQNIENHKLGRRNTFLSKKYNLSWETLFFEH